jgi:hypothetical protein
MTGPAARVWLIAACYGLWAGLWTLATFAGTNVLLFNRSAFEEPRAFLRCAILAVIVAALGWAILHLRRRRPDPGGYIVLPVLVVIIVHFIYVSTYGIGGSPQQLITTMLYVFLFHFWYTIPIAIAATGLLVCSLMRWTALG